MKNARDISEKKREEDAAKGDALPDGSFPIENKEDLENAEALKNKGKNPAAAERLIEKRKKELGVSDKESKWHLAIGSSCPQCGSVMVGNDCPGCGYASQTQATDSPFSPDYSTGLSPNPSQMPPAAMASTLSKWHVSMAACAKCGGEMGPDGRCKFCGEFDSALLSMPNPDMGRGHSDWFKQNPDYTQQPPPHWGKWHLALGEVQQPSAVGQPSPNPLDPAKDPEYLPMDNAASMSYDQEAAFQKWVDLAVDMLNQGRPEQEILAEIAHEGCDDPMAVLSRALEQPINTDGNLQDSPPPEQPPMVNDSTASGEGNTVSQPPAFQAKVKGTDIVGKVEAEWVNLYGQNITRFSTDNGTFDVDSETLEPMTQVETDPVHVIHELLNALPPLEPTKASVLGRIDHLKEASKLCRKALYVPDITAEQMQRIATIEESTRLAILNLTDDLQKFRPSMDEYLSSQRQFTYDGYGIEELLTKDAATTADTSQYDKIMDEHPKLVIHDLSVYERVDPMTVRRAATEHISQFVWELPPKVRDEMTAAFVESTLAEARTHKLPPTEKTAHVEEPVENFDGPASALYL